MGLSSEVAHTIRPPGGDRHGPLAPMLLVLTVATGLVDAASYIRLGHVFVANMTGNVVFLGFAIAGAAGLSVWASLAAIAAFLLGALGGGRLGSRQSHRGRLLRTAVVLELVLILAGVAVALPGSAAVSSATRYPLIALLAAAMGVQNASARRLAVPDMTTTVLTLTLTGIAADSRAAGGAGGGAGRRVLAVAAMFAGALAGGLLAVQVSVAAPLVAAAVLVLAICIWAQSHAASVQDWAKGGG